MSTNEAKQDLANAIACMREAEEAITEEIGNREIQVGDGEVWTARACIRRAIELMEAEARRVA